MSEEAIAKAVDEVFALFELHGRADYIGERISQWEHACQAAQWAQKEGFDDEVVLAALLHDIGHLCALGAELPQMDGFGAVEHEKLGAAFLRSRGFSNNVVKLVESHVAAKRYLCFAEPAYMEQLSDASKQTLKFQGGPMNAKEAMEFRSDPLHRVIIRMRHWDEMAKEESIPTPEIAVFREMASDHLRQQAVQTSSERHSA
jgi:phosphonate degradation associated HDIG domain protein